MSDVTQPRSGNVTAAASDVTIEAQVQAAIAQEIIKAHKKRAIPVIDLTEDNSEPIPKNQVIHYPSLLVWATLRQDNSKSENCFECAMCGYKGRDGEDLLNHLNASHPDIQAAVQSLF